MTFPGAGASVYYNEAGEPLGWDYPQNDEPYDPDDYLAGDEGEDDSEPVCGESYDHDWKPGDIECRRCGADLSEWNEDDEDDD